MDGECAGAEAAWRIGLAHRTNSHKKTPTEKIGAPATDLLANCLKWPQAGRLKSPLAGIKGGEPGPVKSPYALARLFGGNMPWKGVKARL